LAKSLARDKRSSLFVLCVSDKGKSLKTLRFDEFLSFSPISPKQRELNNGFESKKLRVTLSLSLGKF